MSWNQYLYLYHQQVGGAFMGTLDEETDAALLLEHHGGPMLVYCPTEVNGRYSANSIRVRLNVRLEQPYQLRIRRKTTFSRGVNTVLQVVDLGLEKLPGGLDLYQDYGFPEITQGRFVRTNNPTFTHVVLRDLQLRNSLLASPLDGVSVLPSPGTDGLHLVEARSDVSATFGDWNLDSGLEDVPVEQDLQVFFTRLERLLAVAQSTQAAVLAYRMPVQDQKG